VLYGRTNKLSAVEKELLIFVTVTLLAWILSSGNGRYAITLFLLLGASIYIVLKAVFPPGMAMGIFLCVLFLQATAFFMTKDYRFSSKPWSGSWYGTEITHRFEDGLIFVTTDNAMSVLTRYSGEDTVFIAPNATYSFDLNPSVENLMEKHKGNITALLMAPEPITEENIFSAESIRLISKMTYERVGRFGLRYDQKKKCQIIQGKNEQHINLYLMQCPLTIDIRERSRYLKQVSAAQTYFMKVEKYCGRLLSPQDGTIKIMGGMIEKFYRGSDIKIYIQGGLPMAKKYWSMVIFPMGNEDSFDQLGEEKWREQYCLPLARSGPFRE